VHVGAVVADEQRLELVQLSEGALDDAAKAAEPGTALGLAAPHSHGWLRVLDCRCGSAGDPLCEER
jgi:hypothetical protein